MVPKDGTTTGNAGELHQHPVDGGAAMTTAQGIPIRDNQNTLRAGDRGPAMLQDFAMREKIFHFDHERIPERIVHARGSGAHGYFELTKSLSKYTTAKLFTETKTRTPVFTRFSTVAGGAGAAAWARSSSSRPWASTASAERS